MHYTSCIYIYENLIIYGSNRQYHHFRTQMTADCNVLRHPPSTSAQALAIGITMPSKLKALKQQLGEY
ncbi:hypothetical protein ACFX15_029771 [Malus domestica]